MAIAKSVEACLKNVNTRGESPNGFALINAGREQNEKCPILSS